MIKRLLLPMVVIACVVPSTAWAKHDYEYAMALATKKRYYDMAKSEFQRLIDSGDSTLAIKGKFGLTKILIIIARREQDPVKKSAAFDAALKEMEELVESDPDALASGMFDLGELFIEKAKFHLKRIEKESDKSDELTKIARESYDKAIAIFDKVAKKFAEAEEEELSIKYRRSTYYIIECKFEKAVTYKLGDKTRNGILKSLQAKIETFCWDNEDYIEAYYAYTILGQAMANLVEKKHPREEDLEDAFAAFQAALNIPPNPVTEFCRTLAYSRYMGECNRFKFFDRTLALAKKMRKEYPNIEDLRFGQFAVIEEAKAYFGKREIGTALSLVGKIAQKRSGAASPAQLLLGKWQVVAGVNQSANEAFLVAEGFRREREWWKAIKGYQGAIQALGRDKATKEEKDKYQISAWEWSAYCYQRLGLGYESYHSLMAACRAAQSLQKENKAAENAYYAFRAIKRRAASSQFEGDIDLAKRARSFFLDNFKGSPYEPGIRLEQARDMERGKKYADAIAAYKAIPKETEFYEEALSRIGVCWYRQMKDQAQDGDDIGQAARDSGRKALAAIEAYMAYIKAHKAANEASETRRAELLGRVVYNRGSVHDKLGEYDQVLKILDNYERVHNGAQGDLIGAAILLRIKAIIAQSDVAKDAGKKEEQMKLLEKSEREMPKMQRAAGNTRYVAFGNQRIGFAWVAVADAITKANPDDKEGSKSVKRRAMKFLVPWALRAETLKYDHLKFVALICYVLGQEGDAEFVGHATRLLDRAVRQFKDAVEKDKELNLKALLAECYFKTERWGPALELLRSEYAANPRSLFALRSLGRCYFELGAKNTATSQTYGQFIRNSQKEDSALLLATKNAPADKKRSFTKDCVSRASQVYEFIYETASKGKKEFTAKDHKTFQSQLLAKSNADALTDTKKLINQYYFLKLKQLESMSDSKQIRMNARLFAMDRSLYYYRTVAKKVERLKDHWWNAKYYVIAANYQKGLAYHQGGEPGDKTFKKGSDLLRYSVKLIQNLQTLYPSMGGTKTKPLFTELRTKIKEELSGG